MFHGWSSEMNSEQQLKKNIDDALKAFSAGRLYDNAINLFAVMGYSSEKRSSKQSGRPAEFLSDFNSSGGLNEGKALVEQWEAISLLFQITAQEIKAGSQLILDFGTGKKVDNTIIESYLFFILELKQNYYTRTQLATITREINKLFPMPVMILFRHGDTLTLSIIDRRLHKRDESKDVLLKKVTLIKDINFLVPNRAHIEILFDLSLDELHRQFAFTNFIELHRAWGKVLDTSELNKRFFREIANWYFWAQREVSFPKGLGKNGAEGNSAGLIRLITRLIFVWFIKEKKLVPDELFTKRHLDELLNYDDSYGSTYYKAILQNLFFATLNTEMGKREFRHQPTSSKGRSDDYLNPNRYRYNRYFRKPDKFLQLCSNVPFLNGGLFECLDKSENERLDGFSDRPDNALTVPDTLFFSDEKQIDLNEVYGTKNKIYTARGIIEILSSYKFTVAENTPIEEEIALDPELLGKVFENLLAAHNPETGGIARKQTGSFYTPREIVNYMVDETLIAYLDTQLKLRIPSLAKMKDLLNLLRDVLAYTEYPFDKKEATQIVEAIDEIKVFDPACGSGAFPMGMLHKLVFVLGKLDPFNTRWKQLQISHASALTDIKEREIALTDIQQVFATNADYARKLYLIENCLYGVDIQPIAVQIAKLRCFISLVVDEDTDDSRPNRGIRPLPNLETRFIAANSLVKIARPAQLKLGDSQSIKAKEKELADVRRRYFMAQTTQTKNRWRQEDKELRDKIKEILQNNDFPPESARQLADWDPYAQNRHADFFDPEWMFGITDGFDVVIGNPPYLRVQGIQQTQAEYMPYYREHYQSGQGSFDLYALFIERGYQLLNSNGQFAYIVPHKFFQAAFGEALRQLLTKAGALRQIVRFGSAQVFDESTTYTCLLFLSAQPNKEFDLLEVRTLEHGDEVLQSARTRSSHPDYAFERHPEPGIDNKNARIDWDFSIGADNRILRRIQQHPHTLGDLVRKIFQGLATSADNIYVLEVIDEQADIIRCYSKHLEEKIEIERGLVKPFLMGKDVHRYEPVKARNVVIFPYLIQDGKGKLMTQSYIKHNCPLGWTYLRRNEKALGDRERGKMHGNEFYAYIYPKNLTEFETPKIMTPEIALGCQMSFDTEGIFYHTTKVYSFIFKPDIELSTKYLMGILNSKLLWFFLTGTGYVLRGGYRTFKTDYLKPFPIAESTSEQKRSIETLVDYVLHLKAQSEPNEAQTASGWRVMTAYFEQLIDAVVYEIYFPEEFQDPSKSPIRLLSEAQLPTFKELRGDKNSNLNDIFHHLYATDHPVRSMLFFLDTIETVRVIEAKSKLT